MPCCRHAGHQCEREGTKRDTATLFGRADDTNGPPQHRMHNLSLAQDNQGDLIAICTAFMINLVGLPRLPIHISHNG